MSEIIVSALVSGIVSVIITVFWQKIKIFLTYEVYRKVTAYIKVLTGQEEQLFVSYIRSIRNQERTFIDVSVDIKKTLMIDSSNNVDTVTILTAIDIYEQCVVLGLGGLGKSVLIKELERRYADKYLASKEKKYLPFSLSPKNICRKGLIEAIELRCKENGVHIPSNTIEKYSTQQPLMLLIDGVEILSTEERKILSQNLKEYVDKTKCPPRIVLTVASERSDDIQKDMEIIKHMNIVELHEFEDRHIDEYVRNQAVTKSETEKLITVIRSCGKVAKLTRTPILLKMLLKLPDGSWSACYNSWANFIETVISAKLCKRYRKKEIKITPRHKMMALQKIAAAFYQHDKVPPATIEVSAVNAAIQDTFKEFHENKAYQNTLLEELTMNSNFLVAFDDGEHYAFVNKYFQKYFAAKYFRDHEDELLINYRKQPDVYSGVLRLWVGLSDSPINLITAVSRKDPLLCLTLLADVQSPPKDLLDSTLEAVRNEIDGIIKFPDAKADRKQIDEYFDKIHQLCEWVADSTRGSDSGGKILKFLLDMTHSDFLSTRFIISVMALARSYSKKGADRIAEIYNELDYKMNNLRSDEQHFHDILNSNTSLGAGCRIMFYTCIKSGRLPGYTMLDQQRAWIKVNELAAEKVIYKFIKTWIRIEFGTLGESGLDVLIDNLDNPEIKDKEGYLLMLKDIGTVRALREVKRITDSKKGTN